MLGRVKNFAGISFLLVLVAGCAKQAAPPVAAGPPQKPPEVLFEVPRAAQITDYEDFTGRTVASETIEIRARVTGYIHKVNFKAIEGREVEAGSVLFEIDPRPYEAEVARANASLLQAATHLKRVDLDYERARKTVATRTITQEQFDQVAGERAEARAQVEIARADLDLAKLNVSYTKVTAPISGQVSRTQLDQGNLVRADETVLATIVAMSPMNAYFELDERTLLRLRRSADESHDRHPERTLAAGQDGPGRRRGLSSTTARSTTSTINSIRAPARCRPGAYFRNRDRMLLPGMFVRVRLPIGEPYRALLLPEQASGDRPGAKVRVRHRRGE